MTSFPTDAPESGAPVKTPTLDVPRDQLALNAPSPEALQSLPNVKLDHHVSLDTHYVSLHEKNVAAAHEGADVVIDGDSIVQLLGNHRESTERVLGAKVASLGVTSDRADQLSSRLLNGEADFPSDKHPKVAVVMIGTNDLGDGRNVDDNAVAQGIERAATTAHETMPGTKVLVMGLLPRGSEYFNGDEKQTAALNDRIKNINSQVEQWVQQHPGQGVYYADIGSKFLPDNAKTVPSNLMPDGLHPLGQEGISQLQLGLRDAINSIPNSDLVASNTNPLAPQPLAPTDTSVLPQVHIHSASTAPAETAGNPGTGYSGAGYPGGFNPGSMAGAGRDYPAMPMYPQHSYQHRASGRIGFNDNATSGMGFTNQDPDFAFNSLADWLLTQGIDINKLDPKNIDELAKNHPSLAAAAQLALKLKAHEHVGAEDIAKAGLPKEVSGKVLTSLGNETPELAAFHHKLAAASYDHLKGGYHGDCGVSARETCEQLGLQLEGNLPSEKEAFAATHGWALVNGAVKEGDLIVQDHIADNSGHIGVVGEVGRGYAVVNSDGQTSYPVSADGRLQNCNPNYYAGQPRVYRYVGDTNPTVVANKD